MAGVASFFFFEEEEGGWAGAKACVV